MRNLWLVLFVSGVSAFGQALDGVNPPTPPGGLPSELPATVAPPAPRPRPRPVIPTPARNYQVVRPQGQPLRPGFPASAQRYAAPAQLGDNVIAWDNPSKEYSAKPGEVSAPFIFALTNVSDSEVTVNWVRPSCGCTVAKLPPTPWKIAPKEGGTIELAVDLKGKHGTLSKYVSVDTSHGQKMLNIKVHIPAGQMAAGPDARVRNMQLAMADRQIVFRGECASCHSTPAVGKMGGELFTAACAVCHEAPHRATMVPDLRALTVQPNFEYWKHWITHGKPGSLMPAFAKDQGGPLTPEQVESLAEFLTEHYPQRKVASAKGGAQAHAHEGHDHDHEHEHAHE